MFHTILTLSYLIPNVYLFVRIWQLFIPRAYRIRYVVIYVILFSVYPASNLLGEDGSGIAARIFETIANYLLPFFLYLFLFVLLTDLLLLINLVLKLVSRDKIRRLLLRGGVLLIIISLSLTVVIAGVINFNTLRISEYKVNVPARSSDINRLRIAFVSDFHLQELTPAGFVEKFVKKIGTINPDLMLFGGDIVEGDREDEAMEKFEILLGSIRTTYGVFGVLGNHEHYARQDTGSFFNKSGIIILRDSVVFFNSFFILAGRNDSHTRTRKSVDELMKSTSDSLPVILVDHRPTEIDQVSKTHVDIQLSGHTHNGQLFPINLITKKVYELSWGYRKIGNTHFFVSSGIKLWGPPVRTTGKSEVMVIDITFI
jgi:predicted MPP superfamily phosphohydrolase